MVPVVRRCVVVGLVPGNVSEDYFGVPAVLCMRFAGVFGKSDAFAFVLAVCNTDSGNSRSPD